MERHYNTIIIGAGPAGMACGITLRQHGANVCAIDRATFPRPKTCAGLVTQKTWELLQQLMLPVPEGLEHKETLEAPEVFEHEDPSDSLEALFCDRTSEVRLFQKSAPLVTASMVPGVRLVNRSSFDHALVQRYLELGGELRQGETHYAIDTNANRVILKNGDTLHYSFLIFADGALSQSRKLLHLDLAELAFGIEAHIPTDQLPADFPAHSINLYFGYTKSGYIWSFPHGDKVCIGAVEYFQKGMDYREILRPFWKDHGIDPDQIPYVGAMLPYGVVVSQEALPENVLLAGDAAGLTDPISGEGLYMAFFSGMQTANAIMANWPEDQKEPAMQAVKAAYLTAIQPLQQTVTEGRSLQRFFYRPIIQRIFLKKAKGNSRFIAFFFRHQVAAYHYRYRQIFRLYRDYKKSR